MNEVRIAIESLLSGDPIVQALVGLDQWGFVKVYESMALQNTEAPYVTWQIIPGLPPTGDFGDAESMMDIDFQVTGWGENQDEAWQLYGATVDALKADWTAQVLPPWEMIRLARVATPGVLPDETTRWWQVPTTWRVSVSK